MDKKLDKLKRSLVKYGHLQVVKAGYVFSLLITGEGLEKMETFIGIQKTVLECVGDRYPIIEVMKNEESFFCMILKPKE